MKKIIIAISVIVALIVCYFAGDNMCDRRDEELAFGGAIGDIICGAPKIPDHLKLKVDKEEVLGSWEADWIEELPDETKINHGKHKFYKYNTKVEILATRPNEIVSERTIYSRTYKKDDRFVVDFQIGTPYYLENNKVYQVEESKTTIEAFELQTRATIKERYKERGLLGLLVPAYAASPYASYSMDDGDGNVLEIDGGDWNSTTWDIMHDGTGDYTDTVASTKNYVGRILNNTGNHAITRGLFPFNTTPIPANATITSASFHHHPTIVSSQDTSPANWVGIVETFQASQFTIGVTDFEDIGYGTSGESGGNAKDANIVTIASKSFVDDQYENQNEDFSFDSDLFAWIKKSGETSMCGTGATGWTCLGLRLGQDITDTFSDGLSNGQQIRWYGYFADETGTDKDPLLRVEYTVPSAAVDEGDFMMPPID